MVKAVPGQPWGEGGERQRNRPYLLMGKWMGRHERICLRPEDHTKNHTTNVEA